MRTAAPNAMLSITLERGDADDRYTMVGSCHSTRTVQRSIRVAVIWPSSGAFHRRRGSIARSK
jgi:hypothetical protein